MWTRNVVWAVAVAALVGACGGEDEDNGSNPGGTGGGGAGGTAGMMAATGGSSGMTGGTSGAGGATGGMGGGGGFELPECDMMPGPATCGTNTCPTVEFGPLCIKTCCTADMMCGTNNLTNPTCVPANTSMCPNEMVGGSMVMGCCVDGGNECGIMNPFPIGPMCVGRANQLLAMFGTMLEPLNCDGTPVTMMTGGTGGMGGMGGMGGSETGGMGGGMADAGL